MYTQTVPVVLFSIHLSDLMDSGWNPDFRLGPPDTPQTPTSVTSAALKIRDESVNRPRAVPFPDTGFISTVFITLGNIQRMHDLHKCAFPDFFPLGGFGFLDSH